MRLPIFHGKDGIDSDPSIVTGFRNQPGCLYSLIRSGGSFFPSPCNFESIDAPGTNDLFSRLLQEKSDRFRTEFAQRYEFVFRLHFDFVSNLRHQKWAHEGV